MLTPEHRDTRPSRDGGSAASPAHPCPAPGRERSAATLPPEIRMFFTVVKAAGILGIFFYHAYERYLGGQQEILKVFNAGLLRFFFSNTNTLVEYACAVTQTFLVMGNIGAELFVIASGFGLYSSYLSGGEGWGSFFRRRFWRIVPLYYCSLAAGFLFNVFLAGNPFFSSPQGMVVLVQHVLFVQTFTQAHR